MILNHLIGIVLRSQGLVFCLLPGCLSKDVTGTSRNLLSPLFEYRFFHRVSVLRRDRLTFFLSRAFICDHTVCLSKDVTGHCSFYCIALPRSLSFSDFFVSLVFFASFLDFSCAHNSVSVQRRDRVTVLFTALLYQGPSFYPIHSVSLDSFASLLDFLLRYLFTVCLSKDVAGTLSPILILFDPPTTSSFFCLRSVSVQRRDRYSVSFSCLFRLPPFLSFRCSLQVTQCICPKT